MSDAIAKQTVHKAREDLHAAIVGVLLTALKEDAGIHLTSDEYIKVRESLHDAVGSWRVPL